MASLFTMDEIVLMAGHMGAKGGNQAEFATLVDTAHDTFSEAEKEEHGGYGNVASWFSGGGTTPLPKTTEPRMDAYPRGAEVEVPMRRMTPRQQGLMRGCFGNSNAF